MSLFDKTSHPRVLVVHNPAAGLQHGGCPLYDVIDQLEVWGCHVEVMKTRGWESVATLRDEADSFDIVVPMGGDGTLHLVANALADGGVPLGILPCGTANDLAHSLGISDDWRAALECIKHSEPRAIDLGWVNGRYFLNVASLGISAKVAEAVEPASKRRWGKLAYLMETVRQLSSPNRIPVVLTIDGVAQSLDVLQVSVANGVQFGGGWKVAHDASIQDGIFHVVVVQRPLSVRKAKVDNPVLMERIADQIFQTDNLRIDARHTLEVNLDGECARMRPPLRFVIRRASLQVVVPPGFMHDRVEERAGIDAQH